jgi:hypothetical protein
VALDQYLSMEDRFEGCYVGSIVVTARKLLDQSEWDSQLAVLEICAAVLNVNAIDLTLSRSESRAKRGSSKEECRPHIERKIC